MALCKDPALSYLNGLGYNVVRLPRVGIGPLDVLGRESKRIERLGTLNQIWSSPLPIPEPSPPVHAAAINGKHTDDLKLSVGLKILEGILAGMGATVPQINFAYQRARSIQFAFSGVLTVSVDPFGIGKCLAAGDLDSRNPFVAHYFDDEGCEAFVITEVLRSDTFSVTAKSDKGTEFAVDVPAIQQAVGAKVVVGASAARATEVTYRGEESLTFGFKVFGIDYANGAWRVRGVAPGQGMAYLIPEATGVPARQPDPILLVDSGRVPLR